MPRKSIDNSLDNVASEIKKRNSKNSILIQWNQERIEDLKEKNGKVGCLPIDLIKTNQNIRKNLDENDNEFHELVESIKVHGILQPPVVTVFTNEHGVHSVLLVGGERRLRAAKKLGHTNINCLVKMFDSRSTRLTASMSENLNRKELAPIDIADCYFELNKHGYKQVELVKMFGRDRKTIGRYIKIAQWPDNIKIHIRQNSERFTIKYLMELSSRNLTTEELSDKIFGNSRPPQKKRKDPINVRIGNYFLQKDYTDQEKDLILTALKDLEIVKKNHFSVTQIHQ